MFLVYMIFALATNVVASGKLKTCGNLTTCSSNLDYLAISLGSKQQNPTTQNQTFYYIQCWLGVGMVILWFITFSILKYFQKKKEIEVDTQTRSASDFTIVVQGLPNDVTKQQFQSQLKKYQQKIQKMNIHAYKKKPLVITKFNIGKPFFIKQTDFKDEALEKLQAQMKEMKEKLAQWILQRQDSHSFSVTKQQKDEFFKKYEENIEAQKKRITQIGQQMKKKLNEQKSDQNPVYFVTLDSNIAKNTVVQLNPRELASRFRNFITCASGGNNFDFFHKGQNLSLRIQRAPQPQDIIWANIGLTDCQKLVRKFITFTVTIIILGLSFLAVYGLSVAQINNQNNRFLSILISLVISLINIIIAQSIKYLSIFERDYTTIKYQTSLALKSVLASLVNSILIPIVANKFIKNNLYEKNGLADDIFMLGLTNAFVTPILKYIDGGYFFSKFMKWRKKKPTSKLYMSQYQLNTYLTNMDFQIGYQYVYVVHLYLFACFFVSLQPIVCAFAIFGYLLMFWSQKWALFNRMRRPIPGNDLINTAMNQLIFLGPIIYSLGSLTWSNFFPQGTPKHALLPNLIAIGISGFMFIFPLQFIYSCCMGDKQQPQIKYEDSRVYFSAQYDRLNPSTAQQGLKDYMSYVQGKLKGGSKQDQAKFADIFKNVQQKGHRPNAMQQLPIAPQGMMNFFSPVPQPYMMQPSYYPGMMQPQMMMPMNPMMGFGQSPMMMPSLFQPQLQPFNPFGSGFNSGFTPQPFVQPQVKPYQPVQQPQRPPVQQQPVQFIPPQPNVNGFGQPQNQYQPVGYQGNQQPPQGFGQPQQGFGQPQQGFGQPQRFNQPPPPFGQPPGFGGFNPFSNM